MSDTKEKNECPYRIRLLLKSDQKRIAAMLADLVTHIDDDSICNIISSSAPVAVGALTPENREKAAAQKKTNILRIFAKIFRKLIQHFADDVAAFFADLIGVSPEEYDKLPIDIDMQILTQIMEAPEVENFFTGASRVYNTTEWCKGIFKKLKGKLDSVTA